MNTHLRYTLALIAGTALLGGCDRSSPIPTAARTLPIDGPDRTVAVGYVNTTIARTNLGAINYKTNLDQFNVELKTHDDADVEVTHGVAQAGGSTGWHYHPGPVLVMVESGSLTVYQADDPSCTGTTYNAGSTFIEGTTAHFVRNEGATTAEIIGVFFVPAGKPRRIDAPTPGNCPF